MEALTIGALVIIRVKRQLKIYEETAKIRVKQLEGASTLRTPF